MDLTAWMSTRRYLSALRESGQRSLNGSCSTSRTSCRGGSPPTGHLRGSWTVGDIVRKGGEYVVEVYTDIEYADPVNYGHRTRGGGYVPGAHMMEISLAQVEERLPSYLRTWLREFMVAHDL